MAWGSAKGTEAAIGEHEGELNIRVIQRFTGSSIDIGYNQFYMALFSILNHRWR